MFSLWHAILSHTRIYLENDDVLTEEDDLLYFGFVWKLGSSKERSRNGSNRGSQR